jgi:hypothetical protein
MNNPLLYRDPTGHLACSDNHVAEGDCSDQVGTWRYGVTFEGKWEATDQAYVMEAVRDVGTKFAETLGGTAWDAFRAVYGTMVFAMGCSVDECGTQGGITVSSNRIKFSSLDDGALRARNNVVHELGHAFNIGLGREPEDALGDKQSQDPNFPNRNDFPDPVPDLWIGPSSGFASGQNQFTWQQSYSLAGSNSEEFADMFLGWTYNTWETNIDGNFTPAGTARSNFMNDNMPGWIHTAAGY